MPEHPPPQPPAGDPVPGMAGIDIDALLDQAAQLADEACAHIGLDPARMRQTPDVDLNRPPAPVEEQLDKINELVAQANAEAATWAASADAGDSDDVVSGAEAVAVRTSDAMAVERVVSARHPAGPGGAASATTNEAVARCDSASATAVEAENRTAAASAHEMSEAKAPADSTGDAPDNDTPVESSMRTELGTGARAAACVVESPAVEQASAIPDSAASPVGEEPRSRGKMGRFIRRAAALPAAMVVLPLAFINRPFRGFSDGSRDLAGLIGLMTLLGAMVVWMLPLIARR